MKILMVINCLSKGGRERRLLELIKGLKEKNKDFDIYLISLSDKIDYQYVYDLPIKFEIIQKKERDVSLIFKLRKVIKKFNPDIIHSWDVMSSGYLTAANLFLNKILVNGVIYHSAQNSDFYDREYFRVKLFTAISDITVANSQAGLKVFKTSPKKAVCIYNGIDLKRFENLKPIRDVELDILKQGKGDRYIATMVAAFANRKDYDTMIEAAIKLCSYNKKVVFLLIGDGENKSRIMQKVPAELLDKQIYFLGLRDDIESILQITDVGLLISAPCEGLSNSIIEYMASGRPVIATEGGGTGELVRNGENGFLIENKNSSEIIKKMELLMNDPHLAATMGENGSKWVRENLDVKKMTDSYIELYTQLVNRRKGKKVEATMQAVVKPSAAR
jgi:glycosyltransferase involved in cell wall biosynthesis